VRFCRVRPEENVRILYVITPSRLSGAERQLLRTACEHRRTGDVVRVLTKPRPAFERACAEAGIEVVSDRIGGKLNFAAAGRIADQCRAFRADVLVTMHSTATLWGVRGARRAGVPCVAWMQASNTRWPYTTAPAAIGCAEFVRRHLISGGMSDDRVYAVPNSIAPEPYLDDADRLAARDELGLAPDHIAVGTLAHFTPRKAHADLLAAVRLVAPQEPGVRWLWAGEGPLETELKAQVERAGLSERVRFLGFRTDAPRLHRAFDILALPSLVEGLPLVVLEAMASARPCVVTAVSGNPEVVADGVTGILTPPKDPGAMAAALLKLARDPELRAAMGQAGRRRVMDHYTLDRMVATMQAVLEREVQLQRGR
jgi:glycosyltransferase involved in cell wall biosynthesis